MSEISKEADDMRQKIYIVQGSTGEYSDHREWLLAGYFSEQLAADHVVRATRRANELYATFKGAYYNIPPGSNEHDPEMSTDDTGTRYCHFGVEINDTDAAAVLTERSRCAMIFSEFMVGDETGERGLIRIKDPEATNV